MTEGDEDFIIETVVDGDRNGSVVTFNNLGDSTPRLIGFTLRNGGGDNVEGGGIYCSHSSPVLTNLIVTENQARSGGGMRFEQSQAILNDVRIIGNHIIHFGAGLYLTRSNITMQNVIIEGNETDNHGGGLTLIHSDPVFNSVIIRNNIAGTFGGGLRLEDSSPTLTRVAIINNQGRFGGGIHTAYGSNPIMINVTIAGNQAERERGGGIACGETNPTMTNCIHWDNNPPEIVDVENIDATFSNFEEDVEGEGNLMLDPLFEDPDNGDYHLTEDSPCIDAGDPESSEDPDGTRADMGAFYFHQNEAPEIANPIEDVVIDEDSGLYEIADLDTVFFDANGDELSYEVRGSEQLGLNINEEAKLSLEPTHNFFGDDIEVSVFAFDETDSATDEFAVIINQINDFPSNFSLLLPENEDYVEHDENIRLKWEESIDPDPDDNVNYLLRLDVWDWFRREFNEESWTFEVEADSFLIRFDTIWDTWGCVAWSFKWWVYAISDEDTVECESHFWLNVQGPGSVNEDDNICPDFFLKEAYPNPFNSTTTITYALPFTSQISLTIYNLSGRRIETLFNGRLQAGVHCANLTAGDLTSGLYFVKLEGLGQKLTGKIMLIK